MGTNKKKQKQIINKATKLAPAEAQAKVVLLGKSDEIIGYPYIGKWVSKSEAIRLATGLQAKAGIVNKE